MTETLAGLGEFGLIRRIDALLRKEGVQAPGLTFGIGDDAACFRPREGYELVVTCDCIVEGRHYLPDKISALALGRRAMTLNISDIGAVGGHPLYALVSLGLKGDTAAEFVDDMFRGFTFELNPFDASIIGGNLTKSGNGIFIDITLIGEVEQGRMVRRSTASIGDTILITGYPGQSAAGLQILLNSQPDDDLSDHPLVRAYNIPSHRAREGRAIAVSGYASAMIDTSDGFLGDLGHICDESNVGAELIQEKLPISHDLKETALQLKQYPYDLVLQESDDYELLITCPPENVDPIRNIIAGLTSDPVTDVGKITDASGGIQLILPDGSRRSQKAAGWDHFS